MTNGKLSNGSVQNGTSKNEDQVSFLEQFAHLKEEDLVRGGTPENVEQKCLDLCKTYIGGSWDNSASVDDVIVTRITGGLTNQLYKVELKNTVPKVDSNPVFPDGGEPTVVAIKLYQPKHMANYKGNDGERLNDIIVLTILSEVGLGPKVYGIFADGFIQAFHEHEQFGPKQQQNPKLLRELATAMAKVHHLNVPIRKDNDEWMLDQISVFITQGYSTGEVDSMITKLDLKLMKQFDVRQEFQNLRNIIRGLKSPQVFCHCDFRSMNVLVTEPDKKLLLVDLEYSSYGARGYDLATFLMEWGQERFNFKNMGIPDNSALENFARLYIDACDRIEPGYARKPENSLWTVVRETKCFILLQYLFFMAFMLKQRESFIAAIPFDLEKNFIDVEDCYQKYHDVKAQLIKEGVIKQ